MYKITSSRFSLTAFNCFSRALSSRWDFSRTLSDSWQSNDDDMWLTNELVGSR